jgi:glutamyl-tRNA synthetase
LKENNITSTKEYVANVCELMKEKAHFVKEIWELGKYMFVEPTSYDEKVIQKKYNADSKKMIEELLNTLQAVEPFDEQNIHNAFENFAKEKGKIDYQLLRVIITGVSSGPSLAKIMEILGKEKVIKRIETALSTIPLP